MAKTDRQTDKTSRWAFTAYEDQWSLFKEMPKPFVAEWGWNPEICPKTNRKHYQGYLRTSQQQRFACLKKMFPGVHFEVAKDWNALKLYCQKEDTRIPGMMPYYEKTDVMNIYQYVDNVAKRIADLIQTPERFGQIPKAKRIEYVDALVRQDICEGKRYAGHIATNPQWVTLWNKYSYEYIFSFLSINGLQRTRESESGSEAPEGEEGSESA